jgi:hypothetical protein
MVETAIVPVITALAPYVLDSLFGQGLHQHIPKHVADEVIGDHRNISIFSPPSIKDKMSLYGYGYRYPRAEREVRLLLDDKFAKAKILNRAIAAKNPWIKHLRETGTYEKISALLQQAKQTYQPANPLTTQKSARSRKKRLEAELEAINRYGDDIAKLYRESGYGDEATYKDLLQTIKNKLIAEKEAQETKIKALEQLLAKK